MTTAKDFIKFVQDLDLEKMEKEGHYVNFMMEMENTGITELESDPLDKWKKFVDLGGRDITIRIVIPNRRTLEEGIRDKR